MGGTYLQIAAGLAPVFVFFLILYFVQKTHKIRNIVSSIALFLCCVVSIVVSFSVGASESVAKKDASLDKLGIIYAVAEAGEPEHAAQMLQNLRETQAVDDAITLCAARLYGKSGNFKAAKVLYEKVLDLPGEVAMAGDSGAQTSGGDAQSPDSGAQSPSSSAQSPSSSALTAVDEALLQEYKAIVAAANDDKTDYVLLSHFGSGNSSTLGNSPASGSITTPSNADTSSTIIEAAHKAISKSISDSAGSDLFNSDAAHSIVETSRIYDQYIENGTIDEKKAERQLMTINILTEENPELLEIPQFRTARLKMQILCEDYESIAGSVDESSDYNELLIVSELYINSYLETSQFPDSYTQSSKEKYSAVTDQLEKVYDNNFVSEKKSIREPVKEQIKSLKNAERKPALYHIEEGLLDYTKGDSAYDSTKVYLQLAKIENSIGNKKTAESYINSSLNTVGDCDDNNFTQPMYEIVGIISDKDDPEKLKDVAGYVDRILTNNMTIQMPDKLTTQNPDANVTDEGDSNSASGGKGTSNSTTPGATKSNAGDTGITTQEFSTALTDFVSQKRASINIVKVDTSDFSKVSATFNIDESVSYSEEELASILKIQDCGADISDFTIKKVEYSGANILMVCDVSGSMSGAPINHLKEAISLFVENRSNIENIALMTFSSGVDSFYSFNSSSEELLGAAQSLIANGGTNMFDAVVDAISRFPTQPGELNCIILLSDGADNTPRSASDISASIGSVCASKGIALYSIGLGGSVDTAYLNSFAAPTGGSYLHVTDSVTLNTFYEYLHNQILNQYIVTFNAEDTLSVSRTLKISVQDDSLSYDIVPYSLESDSDLTGTDQDSSGSSPIFMENKSISGLNPKLLYKGTSSYNVNLQGSGFTADDNISVALKGNLDYESDKISSQFVDDSTIALTIPAGVACGTYDVHVTINGKKAILDNGLTVVTQGSEKTTVFGPYVFTSYSKVTNDSSNTTTLSGYVNMNGWLGFKDEVVLTGSLEDPKIKLTDNYGTYIQYYTGTSEGLASYLAKNNRTIDLPSLGTMVLYNDTTHSPSSKDYKVDAAILPAVYISNVMTLATPGLMLYPDRIVIDATAFTTDFPFQKKLLKSSGLTKVFSFDLEIRCLLTSKNVGIDLEYKSKTDNKTYSPINLGAMPIYYSPGSFDLKINTVKNEYYIKYIARIAFIDGDGVGISLKWDGNLVPKEVHLYAGIDINTTVSGIPVTYSDFMIGLTDIDINTSVLNWKFEGGMSVSAAKISAVLPKLEKWIGDVSVIKLDDAKLTFSLGQKYISVSTDVKLFEQVTLAKALIEAGNFSYSNQLLNMDSEGVSGLHAALTLGIMWNSKNCDIDLSGNVDLAVTNRVIGATVTGTCDVEIRWWVFDKGFYAQGSTFLGMYKNHKNETVFAVKSRTYSDAKKSKEIYVAWSKEGGLDAGSKKL